MVPVLARYRHILRTKEVDATTRLLLLIAVLVGGVITVRRLLPAERREELYRLAGTFMEGCTEQMPQDSPPKVMVSSLRRTRE